MIKELLSPKQVAQALGVSESSLKRWCDQGLIATIRTGGGHRRLALPDVLRFIRDGEHRLVSPEALGLLLDGVDLRRETLRPWYQR